MKLYFLSENNMDNKVLIPRVPKNFLTINGYEDNTTPRVCFSESISGALAALSQNLDNKELYVHTAIDDNIKFSRPSIKDVPDVMITKERWVKQPVKIKCIGKIIAKDNGKPGEKYKYGDNKIAILYTWDYEWINRLDETLYILNNIKESKDESILDSNFKKKTGLHFKTIDLYDPKALNYISEKWLEDNKIGEIIICVEDNTIAGYCLCNKSGVIAPLMVYRKYRGYGLSEILMKDIINKYGGFKLGVYSDNEVAIRLYKKLGFVEIDKKIYKDGDVVIIMQLKNSIK